MAERISRARKGEYTPRQNPPDLWCVRYEVIACAGRIWLIWRAATWLVYRGHALQSQVNPYFGTLFRGARGRFHSNFHEVSFLVLLDVCSTTLRDVARHSKWEFGNVWGWCHWMALLGQPGEDCRHSRGALRGCRAPDSCENPDSLRHGYR